MADLFDRIALILQSEPTSKAVADLLDAVQVETDRIAARREEIKSEALDPLTQPAIVKKRRAELVEIEFDAERLTVAVGRLETAQEQAKARENQASRQEAYEAARKAMAAAGEALTARWDALAAEMRDLLLAAAEAAAAVQKANKTLPAGAQPLEAHPALDTLVPPVPEKVVNERKVMLWTLEAGGKLIQEDDLEPGEGDRRLTQWGDDKWAVKRPFKETEYVPMVEAYRREPLYVAASIPSLAPGTPAFWESGISGGISHSVERIVSSARSRELQRDQMTGRASRPTRKRHEPLFDVRATEVHKRSSDPIEFRNSRDPQRI